MMKRVQRSIATAGTAFLLVAVANPGCSRKSEVKTPPAAEQHSNIPKTEGMRYYVGGPVMKPDKYGRLRLSGFNGPVTSPSSRGLLIGFKPNDDGTFVYQTWVNGRPVQQSDGFLDEAGLLWFTKRRTFDSDGRVIARQTLEYDNEKQVMKSRFERIDPETGEVVTTSEQEVPYAPPATTDEDEDEDEDGGKTE